MSEPVICYITVESGSIYSFTASQLNTLAPQSTYFSSLVQQYPFSTLHPSQAPKVRLTLPAPASFDPILHWFYCHDTATLTKAIGADSSVLFGISRNAVQIGATITSGIWDVLAWFVAKEWENVFQSHPKWTFRLVPVQLAARAAIAAGGGSVGSQIMADWSSEELEAAKAGVDEIQKVISLYSQDAKKSENKKSVLARLKDLMIVEEKKHVATLVIMRDKAGNVIGQETVRHR
ncbi:hypothetical protein HDU85_001692 [Gaertneriomyces sp. JEL0708]|nr:hypothetical protein HDU85_001692 [Gaertneriomyces sp. JEL0708]